jgi:hypothetical protein
MSFVFVGEVFGFEVNVDPALGALGATAAADYLTTCTGDLTWMAPIFGGITPPSLPFVINIGGGGPTGWHQSCDNTTITCDVLDGSVPTLVNYLAVAEMTEVFEAALDNGWDCSSSNGEGLSGALAMWRYRVLTATLELYRCSAWLTSSNPTRPDWISNTEGTDLDDVSSGCAELFLDYLRYQLLFTPQQIALAGGSTLAQTYATLTGQPSGNAFQQFLTLIESRFPGQLDWGWMDDDPFPLPLGRLFFERRIPSPPYPVLEVNLGWTDTDVGLDTRGGDFGSIASNPAPIQTSNGQTHIFAYTYYNTLLYLFKESLVAPWEQLEPAGNQYSVFGNPSAVRDGTNYFCYVRTNDAALVEVAFIGGVGWSSSNASTTATPVDVLFPIEPIAGDPVAIIANGSVQVYARSGNYVDSLVQFTRELGSENWYFTDLTEDTDTVPSISHDPAVLLIGTTVRLYVRDFDYAIQEIQIDAAGDATATVISSDPINGVAMGVPSAVTDGTSIYVFLRDDLRNLWLLSTPINVTNWTQTNITRATGGTTIDGDPGAAIAAGSLFVYARCAGLMQFRLDPGSSWVATPVGEFSDVTGSPRPIVVATPSGIDVQVYATTI